MQAADAVLATENNMKNARTLLVVGLSAALGMIIVEPARAAAVLVENNRFSCVIEPYSTIELATSAMASCWKLRLTVVTESRKGSFSHGSIRVWKKP